MEELIMAIGAYTDKHNENPKPFIWTAKAAWMAARKREREFLFSSRENQEMIQPTRRALLSTAAGSLAVASASPAPAGKPKIGCTSWAFHTFAPGQDPEPAIAKIGELGFDTVELVINTKPDLTAFWTGAKIAAILKKIDQYKLGISQMAMFQPVVEGLTSTNREERGRNLDAFEAGCKIARQLGAPVVNIVAPWARELKGPSDYLPRYYEIAEPKPGEKFHIDIAPGFDWDALWDAYVRITKECLQRAKAHGLKFSLEHHTHTMIPDTASFLRLWDAIRDPAFGINLDIGWIAAVREYPPVAIHKVRQHLLHLHARDIDGLMRRFPHIGQGVMDLKAVADTLKQIGYTGAVSLEQDKHPGDMTQTCRNYLRMMRQHLG